MGALQITFHIMENQHNKKYPATLNAFRVEIDNIDDQIINLLGQRMEVVNKVGELKKSKNEKFFIKSNREADMIKNLVKKSNLNSKKFPKSAIINIWRKIITAANMHEQSLNIAIHNPKDIPDYAYLVREYYSPDVPISFHDGVTTIMLDIEKGETQIGIFALPKEYERNIRRSDPSDNWWINLANNQLGMKIFAKIPFIDTDNNSKVFDEIDLVAVAIKPAEKSGEDNSLIYVEVEKEVSDSKVIATLQENDLEAKILKSAESSQVPNMVFYLVELKGFYEEDDLALNKFSKSKIKPFVKILGSYAVPIKI